jgi:hypothetical protein
MGNMQFWAPHLTNFHIPVIDSTTMPDAKKFWGRNNTSATDVQVMCVNMSLKYDNLDFLD